MFWALPRTVVYLSRFVSYIGCFGFPAPGDVYANPNAELLFCLSIHLTIIVMIPIKPNARSYAKSIGKNCKSSRAASRLFGHDRALMAHPKQYVSGRAWNYLRNWRSSYFLSHSILTPRLAASR